MSDSKVEYLKSLVADLQRRLGSKKLMVECTQKRLGEEQIARQLDLEQWGLQLGALMEENKQLKLKVEELVEFDKALRRLQEENFQLKLDLQLCENRSESTIKHRDGAVDKLVNEVNSLKKLFGVDLVEENQKLKEKVQQFEELTMELETFSRTLVQNGSDAEKKLDDLFSVHSKKQDVHTVQLK